MRALDRSSGRTGRLGQRCTASLLLTPGHLLLSGEPRQHHGKLGRARGSMACRATAAAPARKEAGTTGSPLATLSQEDYGASAIQARARVKSPTCLRRPWTCQGRDAAANGVCASGRHDPCTSCHQGAHVVPSRRRRPATNAPAWHARVRAQYASLPSPASHSLLLAYWNRCAWKQLTPPVACLAMLPGA